MLTRLTQTSHHFSSSSLGEQSSFPRIELKHLERLPTDHGPPIYRLPSLGLIARTFGGHLTVQATEIGLTPHTDFLQFLGASSIALVKLGMQQSVLRLVNRLHSHEIIHNQMPPFEYSIIPSRGMRNRSIIGMAGQHAAVSMGAIMLTNALVGGAPLGLVAAGVGGALHGMMSTGLKWHAGLIDDDLLHYSVPNRNLILARTITVNSLSHILSSMVSGGFQGFLIAGTAGIIPGSLSCLARVFLDHSIEVPRTLISHYCEHQRGKNESSEESVLFFLPCELELSGEVDTELEEAALIAISLCQGISPWIGPM